MNDWMRQVGKDGQKDWDHGDVLPPLPLVPPSMELHLSIKLKQSIMCLGLRSSTSSWQAVGGDSGMRDGVGASGSKVRTSPDGFAIFGALLNREPDFRSGSANMLNLGLDLGPVRQVSGLNLGSEPDCGITSNLLQKR
jgi:hypothetical protein